MGILFGKPINRPRRSRKIKSEGGYSDENNIDWFKWRPVLKKIATVTEVENMGLSELLDLHEALDYMEDCEAYEFNKVKK